MKSTIKLSKMCISLATIAECEEVEAETPSHSIISILSKSVLFPQHTDLNIDAPEFVPSTETINENEYVKNTKFIPKYNQRAHLNIYIGKPITKTLLTMINESFEDTSKLYYYLDGTTALQLHDEQMHIFQKLNGEKVVLINLDLHKQTTNEVLYGIVVPNDKDKIKKCNQETSDKWLWKLDECLTANEIKTKYEITDLPNSSRILSSGLHSEIQKQKNKLNISQNMLLNINWRNIHNIQQIGASIKFKKNRQNRKVTRIDRHNWRQCVRNSWNDFEPIPMIAYENSNESKHWIEWIKLIYIPWMKSYIGISFKYNSNGNSNNGNLWNLQAIYLDKGAIYNKYRLCGLTQKVDYSSYFNNYKFDTSITHINWVYN